MGDFADIGGFLNGLVAPAGLALGYIAVAIAIIMTVILEYHWYRVVGGTFAGMVQFRIVYYGVTGILVYTILSLVAAPII